jgi:hypothetical protein
MSFFFLKKIVYIDKIYMFVTKLSDSAEIRTSFIYLLQPAGLKLY